MGIKEWLLGSPDCADNQQLGDHKKSRVNDEITFESQSPVIEVNIGGITFGLLVKEGNKWLWQQLGRNRLGIRTLTTITEKLKELNCVSDVQTEINSLESRLMQLEMMNTVNLTRSQVDNIVNEIHDIKLRIEQLMQDKSK